MTAKSGAQICVARADLNEGPPRPGHWKKYYQGEFGEPGIGGNETPVLSVLAILLVYLFDGFSRTVFVLNGIILLLLMVGSRLGFRVIRQLLPPAAAGYGTNGLIYGAGDGGEMVLRELNNNPAWRYVAVGFVDDDPMKLNKVIHGLRVYDANGSLGEVCREKNVEEMLISIRDLPADKLKQVREMCKETNVTVKRAIFKIEPLDLI